MNIYFAPLEGITGFTYRNAFADLFGGIDKFYAPFVSPSVNDSLRGKEIKDLLPQNNSDKVHLIPQILVNRSDYFIKTAKQLIVLGYDQELNINIGCPSGTVVSKKKGAGFLTELDGMRRFFDEIFDWNQGQVDISVKTRIGMYEPEEFPDILSVYNDYPISQIIVHPRTRNELYKGTVHMEMFQYAYENSKNPVCYNGDIKTVADYKKIEENYEIDSVMIGRGLIANPNLANEINKAPKITKNQLRKYHDRLYHDFEKIMKADKHLLFKMKEQWTYMSENFEDSHKCAKLIRKAQNLYKYNQAVEEVFRMDMKTEK